MFKIILLSIGSILYACTLCGQKDKLVQTLFTEFNNQLHHRIYSLTLNDFQRLELIEFKTGKYQGYLHNYVTKQIHKNKSGIQIQSDLIVPSLIAKSLMDSLQANSFETMSDCEDVYGCIEGLDGLGYSFSSYTTQSVNSYYYWEVESDYYYEGKPVPNEVMKIRKILSIIYHEIDMHQQFRVFLDFLPNGTYTYGGIQMIKF